MQILLTEAASRLGEALVEALKGSHGVRPLPADFDVTDPAAAWGAVRGVDAVVCTGQPAGPLPDDAYARDRALLDWATRGTHVLFDAATQAGVTRLVYCSTLDLFAAYPDDVRLSEHWRPDPGTDMRVLSRYLAEQVAREFARERPVSVTVLRLGRLQREDEVAPGTPPNPAWLDPRDAVAAVEGALAQDRGRECNWLSRYRVVHICARAPQPRFLLAGATSLGFEPRHDFAALWRAHGGGAG